LCLCLSHLGDLVLLTPLFANLRQQFPEADLGVVCKSAVADIPRNHPAVDEVITYEARWILRATSRRAGLQDTVKLVRELRAGSYDLLVVCYDHPVDRILGLCTGVPTQVSLDGRDGQQRKSPAGGTHLRHRVEHAFDLLRALEVPIVDTAPSIGLPAADAAWADQWLREQGLTGETILGVHPGAGGPEKRWPAERFARVAENLASRWGCKVVVTGSQVDAEAVQDFMQDMRGEATQAPTTLTVARLCALIQRFAVLLCNDCGPMHIAAALRVPVIAVYGPSSPQLWGPYPPDPRHVVVTASDGKIESITSDEVLAAINCSPLPVWFGEKSTATIKWN
jgi:ADP-heptose:LPS heptosyltransferase